MQAVTQSWQPMQLNLPEVPITDMAVKDNDLIVATQGRSFWILDDLGVFQNGMKDVRSVVLFQPKKTYRIFGGQSRAVGQGMNPKSGVTFDYYLNKDVDTLNSCKGYISSK